MTVVRRENSPTPSGTDLPAVYSSGRTVRGNLPAELSSFIGRHRELREVKRLMATARLVTLTGTGGVGKTRLAQRVATEIRRAFPEGTWFVGLADIVSWHWPAPADPPAEVSGPAGDPQRGDDGPLEQPDPDLLAQLVGAALGLREQAAIRSVSALCAHLAGRRLLLVLDNCEHVSAPVAVLVEALLRRCPELRVISTTREPLGVPGEVVFPVPTLPTPDPPGGQALDGYESVALFLARASTAVPGFRLTAANGPAIAGICRRLDGLPLAIELAAAWLPVLAPQQILDRLDDRFALLNRGSRSGPGRHQTLRASIDWSYHLCTPPERLLWGRLSVFTGAFELDGAEGVCADDELPTQDVLDLVTGLLDKSVLIRDGWGLVARYRMLESVRAYAQQQVRERGDEARLRRAHRDWYAGMCRRAYEEWLTPRQTSWLARLEREHANIRTAVEYCLTEPGEAAVALDMAVSLPPLYWAGRGLLAETRRWLEAALRTGTSPSDECLRAVATAGVLAALERDVPAAVALTAQARELADRIGTELARAQYLQAAATDALYRGDPRTALTWYLEALAVFRTVGDVQMQLRMLNTLGLAGIVTGDLTLAIGCCHEVLAMTEATGEVWHRCVGLTQLGFAHWRQGEPGRAATVLTEALELRRLVDDPLGTAWCLETLAWISAREGATPRAAVLFGAVQGLAELIGTPYPIHPVMATDHDVWERHTREALGTAAFEARFRHGRGMSAAAAIAFAQQSCPEPEPVELPHGPVPIVLTRREREVSELIAAGLTNKEIAARLVISRRTAESHVEHILAKLGFGSRAQIAAWAAGPGSADLPHTIRP